MTTVWLRTLLLQRWILNAWRDVSVTTSSVVPTNKIRNAIRSGVMMRMLIARANSDIGVMSPYPVVESVTAA